MADVLVDAGALIALLDRDDPEHDRAAEALKSIREPLATVWPALTEAMQLLADTRNGRDELCDMVSDGLLKLLPVDAADVGRIRELMRKYADVPMNFADAALVCVAERDRLTRIVTFDSDFDIYRLQRRTRFIVLPRD